MLTLSTQQNILHVFAAQISHLIHHRNEQALHFICELQGEDGTRIPELKMYKDDLVIGRPFEQYIHLCRGSGRSSVLTYSRVGALALAATQGP